MNITLSEHSLCYDDNGRNFSSCGMASTQTFLIRWSTRGRARDRTPVVLNEFDREIYRIAQWSYFLPNDQSLYKSNWQINRIKWALLAIAHCFCLRVFLFCECRHTSNKYETQNSFAISKPFVKIDSHLAPIPFVGFMPPKCYWNTLIKLNVYAVIILYGFCRFSQAIRKSFAFFLSRCVY